MKKISELAVIVILVFYSASPVLCEDTLLYKPVTKSAIPIASVEIPATALLPDVSKFQYYSTADIGETKDGYSLYAHYFIELGMDYYYGGVKIAPLIEIYKVKYAKKPWKENQKDEQYLVYIFFVNRNNFIEDYVDAGADAGGPTSGKFNKPKKSNIDYQKKVTKNPSE